MTYDRTRLRGRFFDRERARKGPAGNLILLKYRSKSAEVITYDVVKEYSEGWRVATIKGPDGAFYTAHEIADVDGSLQAIMDADSGTVTDYVVEGRVWKIEPDKISRPSVQPKIWTFQGYDTGTLYA